MVNLRGITEENSPLSSAAHTRTPDAPETGRRRFSRWKRPRRKRVKPLL